GGPGAQPALCRAAARRSTRGGRRARRRRRVHPHDDTHRPRRSSRRSSPQEGRMTRLRPAEIVSIAVLAFLVVAAVAPALLAPADPLAVHPSAGFLPPSFSHIFGTDESGRDIFTRVVHGTGPSLLIGLSATAIGVGLALVLGLFAGLGPRWLDFGTTRF